jgi:hypothetical protein
MTEAFNCEACGDNMVFGADELLIEERFHP